MTDAATQPAPALSGIVVHWRNEDELATLLGAWPLDDPRFELLVVDNSRSLPPLDPAVRYLDPATNLGFGGGVDHGVSAARAPLVLMLNPDARPKDAATLEALLDAFAAHPDAAGIVPALEGPEGRSQCRWQLRPLPSPWALIGQTLRFVGVYGPTTEPPAGTPIAQPAAAALALRRDAYRAVGGFDPHFHPAWFEDVDLAKRLAAAGQVLRFAPAARFVHDAGASVPRLGYGRFLWLYYRNLDRYLRRHHGATWARLGRLTLLLGMLLRLALLPLRRPRQATDRRAAAQGLWEVILGVLSGWQRPAAYHALNRTPERTTT